MKTPKTLHDLARSAGRRLSETLEFPDGDDPGSSPLSPASWYRAMVYAAPPTGDGTRDLNWMVARWQLALLAEQP